MNINFEMLKKGRGQVDDRLYDNDRNYCGQITKINNTTGELTWRRGIFYDSGNFKNLD
jgi:ASC-1-like (ASCH) protein